MEEVKFITFDTPGAPRLKVRADASYEEIAEILKSADFENFMVGEGFAYKYGLQPVNMLEPDNLNDNAFTSGAKGAILTLKQIGNNLMGGIYDVFGNTEAQAEAKEIYEQYKLDRTAYIFRQQPDGSILPRPSTIEDVLNDEKQFKAFTQYLGSTISEGAITSVPIALATIAGATAGSIFPGIGTAAGGTSALLLSSYLFGVGDIYGAQIDAADGEDPVAGIAFALGVPYAYAERLFGVSNQFISRTVGKKTFENSLKKGVMEQLKNRVKRDGLSYPKNLAKHMAKVGASEAVAEGVQETLNITGGEFLQAGKSFEDVYLNKDFAKQIGEASAAGFFGGFGFGVIQPTIKQFKLMGKKGAPEGFEGEYGNFDTDPTILEDSDLEFGDNVSVAGIYTVKDITGKESDKGIEDPELTLVGNAVDKEGNTQLIVEYKGKTATADGSRSAIFIPKDQSSAIFKKTPKVNNEVQGVNYKYNDEQDTVLDDNVETRREYSEAKKKLEQTGVINDSTNKTVDSFLDREKDVERIAATIELDRKNQKDADAQEAELENEAEEDQPIIRPTQYAEYLLPAWAQQFDGLEGDALRTAINKYYPNLRKRKIVDLANDQRENELSEEDNKELTRLGFNGPLGRETIQGYKDNITPVGNSTVGRRKIRDVIDNKRRFEDVVPVVNRETDVIVGEKVQIIEPLSETEKASLTGEMLADPTAGPTFVYNMNASQRIREIRQLAQLLDYRGWKIAGSPYYPAFAELVKQKQKEVNSTFDPFVRAKLRQELKDLKNQGFHILGNPFLPKDAPPGFLPVGSPMAISTAEQAILNLRKDARLQSDDAGVRKQVEDSIKSYEYVIEKAIKNRNRLNELLTSLTLEPITNWNAFNGTVKGLAKFEKQIKQTETIRKVTPIKAKTEKWSVMSNTQPRLNETFKNNALKIAQLLRRRLDALGLSTVQLDVLDKVLSRDGFEVNGKYLVGQRLVQIALNARPDANIYDNQQDATLYTLHHEVIHALKDLGLFTQQEYQRLREAALSTWIDQFDIRTKYPNLNLEEQVEEAISEAFANHMVNRFNTGTILGRAFQRIKAFIYALSDALRGAGFNNVTDIFEMIDAGIIGNRDKSYQAIADSRVESYSVDLWKTQEQEVTSADTSINKDKIARSFNILDKEGVWGEESTILIDLINRVKKIDPSVKRNPKTGVGKKIGGDLYVHKSSENVVPNLKNFKNKLPKGFVYDVVKYSEKDQSVSFIKSPDWNIAEEPLATTGLKVLSDGKIKELNINQIYHHKWLFVKDDYQGFNVEDSIKRSLAWLPLRKENKIKDFKWPSIGRQEAWNKVSPYIPDISSIPTVTSVVKINLDLGGGKFDNVAPFLKSRGVTNYVFDPYNRTPAHNAKVVRKVANGQSDTVTINNVLNVIPEENAENQRTLLLQAKNALKMGGTVYILVYEGNKKGVGKYTSKGYQHNKKTAYYLPAIKSVFPNAFVKNGIVRATKQTGSTKISKTYNDPGSPPSEQHTPLNRTEKRKIVRDVEKYSVQMNEPYTKGGSTTPTKMGSIYKFIAHYTRIAADYPIFTPLFNFVQQRNGYTNFITQFFSGELGRKYLRIKEDPKAAEAINKAHIIALMTDTKYTKNAQGEIILTAPMDSSDKNRSVKAGEVVVLTGDVADAFEDYDRVIATVNKTILQDQIAGEYGVHLIDAINFINKFLPNNGQLPDLTKMSQEERENFVEEFELKEGEGIVGLLTQVAMNYQNRLYGIESDLYMDEEQLTDLGNILRRLEEGFMVQAKLHKSRSEGYYAPMSRYGTHFIAVKDAEDRLIWYEQIESDAAFGIGAERKARERYNELVLQYPDATVSKPELITIEELRNVYKREIDAADEVSGFLSDSNATKYNKIRNELTKKLKLSIIELKEKENNFTAGFKYFYMPKDKSVGMEGVPGYETDFTRSTLQFISSAAAQTARNRFAKKIALAYKAADDYAKGKENRETKDVNLDKLINKWMDYSDDPTQELAGIRRLGFWWYLGGNLSSAFLQTISAAQFTGPMLAELTNPKFIPGLGAARTTKALTQSIASASAMVGRATYSGSAFQDALLNLDKVPDDRPGLKAAILRAIADGTIKQGQAIQESGITEMLGGTENQKRLRLVENTIIGGAFNTMESFSRISAFIAAYRMASDDPRILDNARILFEDNADFQFQIEQNKGKLTPEILARFMTNRNFGVYGKINRQYIGRGPGAAVGLFMTYISQMVGEMVNALNPPVIRKTEEGHRIQSLYPNRSRAQNRMQRKMLARMLLMIMMTGGIFAVPGGEDAEDIVNMVRSQVTGIDSDIRNEFRQMLYDVGFSPKMITFATSGAFNAFGNMDLQRRVGFGNLPWSTQVRALGTAMGINTGVRAEEFLGAPGSIFISAAQGIVNDGLREGNYGQMASKFVPNFIRNAYKGGMYAFTGEAYSGRGVLLRDDLGFTDAVLQAAGYTPAKISAAREALFLEKKLGGATGAYKTKMNARITNAYVEIIQGERTGDTSRMHKGQETIEELTKEIIKFNSRVPPTQVFVPDLERLYDQALQAVMPNYRIEKQDRQLFNEKRNMRMLLGLDG